MSRSGEFIIVEGIDGSGKDTQAELLAGHLRSMGRKVLVTKSPSDWYRNQPSVKSFIEDGKTDVRQDTLAVLGAADRMMNIDQVILPALRAGTDVICVRYIYSGFGYFLKRGADMRYVEAVNSLVLRPSYGLLLEIDPEVAVGRVVQRDSKTQFEERAGYLGDIQDEMVRRWPPEFLRMDATLPEAEIAAEMLRYVTGSRTA